MMRVTAPRGAADILYGEAPFGWRLSKDRSHLVKDPKEQRVLTVVRHMYFVRRLPMREVVAELRDMGILNRRGTPFGLSRVFEMVHDKNRTPKETEARQR
jgi:hypothetical protein